MRAVVAREGQLNLEDVPEPTPGPGQVLCAPVACGICGSDVHALALQAADPEAAPTAVLGHEFCVEVLDFGPDTERRVKPGALVCSMPFIDAPEAPELLGFSGVYPGGFSEQMVVQEDRLLAVPAGFDPDVAALTEPLAVGFHAVAAARLEARDVVLVLGCGPVGLAVITALKVRGHGPVVASDFSPVRRAAAERMGADVVLDPADTTPYENWAALAGDPLPPSPLIPGTGPVGNTVVFECVGAPGLLQQVIDAVPQHTRIVVVGACAVPDPILPVIAISKELSVQFMFAYRPSEFADAFAAVTEGKVDVASWITGRFGLERAVEALDALADPQHHCKILLSPRFS